MSIFRPRGDLVQAFRLGSDAPWPAWLADMSDKHQDVLQEAARGQEWVVLEPDGNLRAMMDWRFRADYQPMEAR